MPTNAERQRAFQARKRAEKERREFEQFIIDASFGSSTTDVEKYLIFQSNRLTVKANERKRKRAEAARERRRKLGRERATAEGRVVLADPTGSREVARKRKRAEAARDRRKKRKQEGTVSGFVTVDSRNVRSTLAEPNAERGECEIAEAALEKRELVELERRPVVELPEEIVVEPPVSMWLEDD